MSALVAACHPAPTVAVTTLTALVAVAADVPPGRGLLVTVAVLVGQLSIGWSNDWLDAARDAAVARADKPVATGRLPVRVVAVSACLALAVAVLASSVLGLRATLAHVVLLGGGWAYNLGVKSTNWSWLPYAVAFGALPGVVTSSRPDHPWPAAWAVATGALLGVGAHFANVLPDLDDDARTGVRGLPHRLGRRVTGVLGPVILLAASVVAVVGPPGAPTIGGLLGLAVAVALVIVAAVAAGRGRTRLPFVAAMLVALVDVVLLVAGGTAVVG